MVEEKVKNQVKIKPHGENIIKKNKKIRNMSRSNWKGPYSKLEILKQNSKNYISSRRSKILTSFIGSTFKIHNGKKYVELTITEEMVGYKFGEFASTRVKFTFKKSKKK